MATFIALLRGINVVGNNKLPMKELSALLTGMGLSAKGVSFAFAIRQ